MIKEALEYLANLGKATTKPELIPMGEGNDDERVFILNGEVHKFPVRPLPRCHNVDSLDDLMAAAERFATLNDVDDAGLPSIFYDVDRVQLVIDDSGHRRNSFTFDLELSNLVQALHCHDGQWFDQKSFLRVLKVDLRGTVDSVGFIDAVKCLKFENSATTTGVIDRSKESMGRDLKSSVSSKGDELPEVITFNIPVFGSFGERERHLIQAAVETEAVSARIRYVVLPEEYDRAVEAHLATINERLRERLGESVHIYHGRP